MREDRAKYGDRLMDTLAETLTKQGVSRCDWRELYRYRQFYLMYPQIVEALTPQFMPFQNKPIRKTSASKSCVTLEYSAETDAHIQTNCRDSVCIERLLDGILDFCFDTDKLLLLKSIKEDNL